MVLATRVKLDTHINWVSNAGLGCLKPYWRNLSPNGPDSGSLLVATRRS
jgi:hypothetical protein